MVESRSEVNDISDDDVECRSSWQRRNADDGGALAWTSSGRARRGIPFANLDDGSLKLIDMLSGSLALQQGASKQDEACVVR